MHKIAPWLYVVQLFDCYWYSYTLNVCEIFYKNRVLQAGATI